MDLTHFFISTKLSNIPRNFNWLHFTSVASCSFCNARMGNCLFVCFFECNLFKIYTCTSGVNQTTKFIITFVAKIIKKCFSETIKALQKKNCLVNVFTKKCWK